MRMMRMDGADIRGIRMQFVDSHRMHHVDMRQTIREKIDLILSEVRPLLEAHGGGASIVNVDDAGNVILKIEGACVGCAMSSLTFGLGIEKMIRERVPEVKSISYT